MTYPSSHVQRARKPEELHEQQKIHYFETLLLAVLSDHGEVHLRRCQRVIEKEFKTRTMQPIAD